MKVRSADQLKQLALARGASLELENERFNSSREKVASIARKPAVAKEATSVAPPATPAVTEVKVDMLPVAAAVAESTTRVGELIAEALASMPQPAPSALHPRRWTFAVQRDKDGLIETVVATSDG